MFRQFVAGVALCGVLAVAPVRAASVIDFDDLVFADYDPIPAGYGSNLVGTPDVTVSYKSLNADGSVFSNSLLLWHRGYGDLTDVSLAAANGTIAEVRLDAAVGYEVQLQSFLLAGWPETSTIATVLRVLDGAGTILWDASNTLVLGTGSTHSTFTPPNLSGSTLRIQWGTNWNIGIDDITFSQAEVAAVPEPASLAMLSIGGVAAALVVARRKRA